MFGKDEDGNFDGFPENKPGPSPMTVFLLTIFPVSITAWIVDKIFFRKLKYRPTFTAIVILPISFILLALFYFNGYAGVILDNLGDIFNISENWTNYIVPLGTLILGLGGILGVVYCFYEGRRLKMSPWLLTEENRWYTGFKYNKTPFEKRKEAKLVEALKNGEMDGQNVAPLGIDLETHAVVDRYIDEAFKHTLVQGTSGSGKTVTMTSLIRADMQSVNRTIAVIDFKASSDLAGKLAIMAKEHGKEFYHFSASSDYSVPCSKGQCTYDPFGSGTASSKSDKLLALRQWDTAADVYKVAMESVTKIIATGIHIVQHTPKELRRPTEEDVLNNSDIEVDWDQPLIPLLDIILEGDNIKYLYRSLVSHDNKVTLDPKVSAIRDRMAKEAKTLYEEVAGKSKVKDRANALLQLKGRIRTMMGSDFGPWFLPDGSARHINLSKLLSEQGNVILFSIAADDAPELGKFIGSLIFADITTVSSEKIQKGKTDNLVCIYSDEFQSANPESVRAILQKGREAKMAVTLGCQSLDDIVSQLGAGGEAFVSGLIGTCSNFIVHSGTPQESALRMSDIVGQRTVNKYSVGAQHENFFGAFNFFNQRELRTNRSTSEEWIYPPKFFMDHSIPSKANNYYTTATILKKSDSSPDKPRKVGPTARRVWLVPHRDVSDPLEVVMKRKHIK